mgnify:CR=1 FL=1
MNNSYNIIKFDSNYDDLVNSGVISPLNRYKYSFYINSDKLFFKEDTDRMYYELIGTAIGDYLNILHTSYKLTMIETSDTNIKGVTSKDYRKDGYKLIKFNNILFGKEMTLDNISERLNIYFNDYRNKDIIVNDIYNDVITYYMLDLLLGNIDNGKYNYEFMASDTNAKMSPYSDFGMIFNKKNELENISVDVVNMLNKDIPLEEIKSEYADIDIEISSDDKYKNVVISDKIDILTPGLNRILGNPYEVKVERKIPNV